MTPFESLLMDRPVMAELEALRRVPPTTLPLRVTPSAESIRETARSLARPGAAEAARPPVGGPPAGMEAIVLAFGRPTLLIQDHTFALPELEEWRLRLEPLRGALERALPSVGRIEIRRLPQDVHLGTGWLVAEDVVVTNRHVAEFFSRGSGRAAVLAKDPMGRDVPVQIDFREEHARSTAAEHAVAQILWIEELDEKLPDLALLKLRSTEHASALPPPIPLLDRLPTPGEDVIAVIGYPAWDYRNDAAVMKRLFGDIYGVKRLAPGHVMRGEDGFVFEHDCTTLGGNSGSVVLDAANGQAVGLHFAGEFGVRNIAVRSERIAKRLSELEVRVAVPASYVRLGDRTPGADLEKARGPEEYAGRVGFVRGFVSGAPAAQPDFSQVAGDIAQLREHGGTELRYTHFSVWMSASRRLALCTAVNIDGGRLSRYVRGADRWYLDPRLEPDQQIGNEIYVRNRLDRGHLVRRLDPVWGEENEALEAMEDTFHYTNAAPQHEDLNQATWSDLEDYILDNAEAHELKINVFTGPVFHERDIHYRDVEVPAEYWKIVVMSRRTSQGSVRPLATAYLLSQADLLGNIEFAFGAFRTWQVPITLIEQKTGILFPQLRSHDPLAAGIHEGIVPTPQLIRSWRDIVLEAGRPRGPVAGRMGPRPLDLIRERLLAAQRAASLDYILEFDGQPPADIVARVTALVPGVVGVEPVFENDPRFQRIRLPGLDARSLAGASPFDLVEPLRAALGARSVEPDLATDFFPEAPSERAAPDLRESADLIRCWVNDSEPAPTDRAWALRNMGIPGAWQFSDAEGRPSRGEGILVAQPDTGVTDHPELADGFDKTLWADFLDGGPAWDPLINDDPMDTPGHGTATGSVVISRGTVDAGDTGGPGHVTGSAPDAVLVPIRCIESVVRITQSRVARAIEHAVDSGCHVITMSLGGLWSRSLAVAVERAIENNLLVLAAAGNCVNVVVWPARFERCIAVAGSNVRDAVWKGSSRGSAVDVTAPAQHVYRASRRPNSPNPADFGPGEGTSFAVALTAGVAAMWLAHHGRQQLIDSLTPGEKLQDRFISLLRRTARVPAGWNKNDFGAGIVDATALLRAGLGVAEAVAEAGLQRAGTPMQADQAEAAREFLAELAGRAEVAAVDPAVLDAHGLELIWLALERQRRPAGAREAAGGPLPSSALREALARPENMRLAASLGVPAQAPEPPARGLEVDPHMDPEQRSPEFAPGPLEAVRPWRVAECLLVLRRQVDAKAPSRNTASDGTIGDAAHAARSSDHNPWVVDAGTGIVTAMDITHDPGGGCDAGALAEAIRAGQDPRVKYVIWNRRIMSSTVSPWTWRTYTGENPHTHHVHISVRSDKEHYDSNSRWNI